MIYSCFLYTEFEQHHNDDGEGAYTIFSTEQLFGPDCIPLDVTGIQKFAVLWEGHWTAPCIIDISSLCLDCPLHHRHLQPML